MAKVYNTVDFMVSELMNYLALYRELILSKQFDPYYQKQAEELLEEILQLEDFTKNNGNLASFNFDKMKNRFVAVFHPDRFKLNLENIENPEEVFGKALNIFQDISKEQKNNTSSKFTYDSTSQKAYRTNTQQAEHRRRNNNATSSSYQEKTQTQEDDSNFEEDDVDYDKEVEKQVPFILQFISDKFNAIFRNIPSSKEDYENILARFQKKIDSLEAKDSLLTEIINSIQRRRQRNQSIYLDAVSDERINEIYYEKVNYLKDLATKKQIKFRQAQDNCNNRYHILSPEIQGHFTSWQREAQQYYYKYTSLVKKYSYSMSTLSSEDTKSMRQEIERMRRYIDKNYTDEQAVFTQIRDRVLQGDLEYCELYKNLEKAEQSYDNIQQRLNYILHNPNKYKANIRAKITSEYEAQDKEDSKRYDNERRKRQNIKRKLNSVKEERESFVIAYGEIYGNSHTR